MGSRLFGHCFPPCGRAYFFLLRQEKVAKKKATPGSAPATRVPCATRLKRGLRNSGCALRQSSPFLRLSLRCSAPLMGTRKASRLDGSAQEQKVLFFYGCLLEIRNNEYCRFGGDAFPGPHVERRATELMADKGRGLSEGRSPEFRSPRQQRVAQGSRRSRPRSLGSPSSLATFFLAKQEESTPARKAEPSHPTRTTAPVAETETETGTRKPNKHHTNLPLSRQEAEASKATAC